MAKDVMPTPPPRRKNSSDAEPTPPRVRQPLPKLDVSAATKPLMARVDPEAGHVDPSDAWGLTMPTVLSSMDKAKVASYLQGRMKDVKDGAFQTAKSSLSTGERFTLAFLDKMKRWSRRGFTHIFLFAVLMLYNVIGACIMMILERPAPNQHLDLEKLKGDMIERLVRAPGPVDNSTVFRQEVRTEIDMLLNTSRTQFELYRWFPDPDNNPWGFWGSLFFCFTIHSTIGYGHLTPVTTSGRAVSIVYAILGIPIFLIVLADYGKLFTRALKSAMAAAYRLYHTKSCTRVRRTAPVETMAKGIRTVYDRSGLGGDEPDGEQGGGDHAEEEGEEAVVLIDDEFNLPVSLALFILLSYLFIGAVIFMVTEDWSYFEAFYFVFISMTTIGFGDLVPSSVGVIIGATLYMIFGLALTSMCINVIQEKMTLHFKHASVKLGTRFGVSVPVTPAPALVEVAPVHGKVK